MKKKKTLSSHTKGTVQSIETLLEVLLLSVLYFVFWWKTYDVEFSDSFSDYSRYLLVGVYAVLTYLFIKNSDGFQFGQLRKADLAVAQWIALLLVNTLTYFQLCLVYDKMLNPAPMLLLMLADVVLCFLYIHLMKFIYYILYPPYNMVMIYGSKTAAGMKLKMDSRRDKYQVNALISSEKGYDYIVEKLEQYDAAVLNDVPNQLRNDIVKYCYQHRIRVYVVPKITDIILRNGFEITAFDTPLLMVSGQGLTFGQRFFKRAMDIILSAIALIPAAPIMLLVALAIKIEDGGPVFYKQERVTLNDKPFYVTKFRSMIVDAEKYTGAVLAADNDPRITKVGKFIRATRLDELPQLLNILKGDMSVVGPRPERMSFIQEFCKEIPEFAYRTKVKAGLTGYAQIYGKYNTCPYDKLRMDLMYIEHYSLQMDIKLILMTVRIIFSKESTEGIDVAEENQKKVDAMLDKLQDEEVCAEDFSGSK